MSLAFQEFREPRHILLWTFLSPQQPLGKKPAGLITVRLKMKLGIAVFQAKEWLRIHFFHFFGGDDGCLSSTNLHRFLPFVNRWMLAIHVSAFPLDEVEDMPLFASTATSHSMHSIPKSIGFACVPGGDHLVYVSLPKMDKGL